MKLCTTYYSQELWCLDKTSLCNVLLFLNFWNMKLNSKEGHPRISCKRLHLWSLSKTGRKFKLTCNLWSNKVHPFWSCPNVIFILSFHVFRHSSMWLVASQYKMLIVVLQTIFLVGILLQVTEDGMLLVWLKDVQSYFANGRGSSLLHSQNCALFNSAFLSDLGNAAGWEQHSLRCFLMEPWVNIHTYPVCNIRLLSHKRSPERGMMGHAVCGWNAAKEQEGRVRRIVMYLKKVEASSERAWSQSERVMRRTGETKWNWLIHTGNTSNGK